MEKLVKWFIGFVFVLILCQIIAMVYLFITGSAIIEEKGVKGLSERVWCGKDVKCKLPEIAQ